MKTNLPLSEISFFEDPTDQKIVDDILNYTQYLLDDEDNLTRLQNLTGEAKEKLRKRIMEVLGIEDDPSS